VSLAAGVAGANSNSRTRVARMPAVALRLQATLAPVGTARGSGSFDALLIRTGPGLVRVVGSPRAPAPPIVCPPNPRMGIPCRIGGDWPPFPIPPTGIHWTLVWRLSLTGVTGPATASIHAEAQGAASPILATLCTNCLTLARGYRAITATQAQMLLKGHGYVDVQAASGELSGQIVTINHFASTLPARY
jgi:hypothetical protein